MKPEIICISETHLTEIIDSSEICIDEYECYRTDSLSRHTGGVQMYIKNHIKVLEINRVVSGRSYWLLSTKLNIHGKIFFVVCLYRSPNSSCAEFMTFFETWCNDYVCDVNVPLIIFGDFNINWLSSDFYSNKFKALANDMGLLQIVNEITRPAINGGTLIDLVFTNQISVNIKVLQVPRISDHFMISLETKLFSYSEPEPIILESRGKKINFELIRNKLSQVVWDFHVADIDKKCDNLILTIRNTLNIVAPLKTIKIQPRFKPWWNERVEDAVRARDDSYRQHRLVKSEASHAIYKENRNMAVRTIRQEKIKYFENQVDQCKNDPPSMWSTLGQILPQNRKSMKVSEVHINGEVVNDKDILPDRLNSFYIDSIEQVVSEMDDTADTYLNNNNYSTVLDRFDDFRLVDSECLRKVVFSLKSKSSPDEISVDLLKNIYDAIEDPLINLINCSFETGEFPNRLKMSTIIPVQKKENVLDATNFRPINTLATIEKVIEKIVYRQLLDFVERNGLITKFQSGFRAHHSCETAVQCVVDEWKNWADSNYMVIAVFLDLQRAFETVDRKMLLSKLEMVGVGGCVLRWFKNYLASRVQNVRVNGRVSGNLENYHGVPQGSVLGPLLFILYINDMADILRNANIHLFADDTLVYAASRDLTSLVENMNATLNRIYTYTVKYRLKLNASKSKFMLITNDKTKFHCDGNDFSLMVGCNNIQRVQKFKYLGVIVDDKLLFGEHCNYIVSKISFGVNYLSRCSYFLSFWSRLVVYNTIVLPHFNFCATIMYLFKQNEVARLQKLQNRAMRIILSCSRYTPINSMLRVMQWLPVVQFVRYSALVFIFKIKIGCAPEYLVSKIVYNKEVHNYNTRGRNDFFITPKSKKCTMNSIFHNGFNEFNNLPEEIKTCTSVLSFKKKLKIHLLGTCDILDV